jgi:hypothetical protein
MKKFFRWTLILGGTEESGQNQGISTIAPDPIEG